MSQITLLNVPGFIKKFIKIADKNIAVAPTIFQ